MGLEKVFFFISAKIYKS